MYFDDSGSRIINIGGKIPEGMDLTSGWGRPVDGLACGVAFNRTAGKLADLTFTVALKNWTPDVQMVLTCLPYQQMKIEVRDQQGRVVSQDTEYIRSQDAKLRPMKPGTYEGRRSLRPYECGSFDGGHALKEWYTNLPPGQYTLKLRRRATGSDFVLTAPPVSFAVLPD